MKGNALVTGGTGLLGSWLICALLKSAKHKKVYAIVRALSNSIAQQRMDSLLKVIPHGLSSEKCSKLIVYKGDVSWPNLGLDLDMLEDVSDIFHIGAIADFNANLEEIRPTNVVGTRNVFEMARALNARQLDRPIRVHHISTVAVAGNSEGWYGEDQFNVGQSFNNAYEQSKFEAEEIAREFCGNGMAVNIYRPAIITGDSNYGITTNFKMIYQPLHFLAYNLFRELPGNKDSLYSFVPVDKVSDAISLLSQRNSGDNVYHLVNPNEITLDFFIETASKIFKFKRPLLVPMSKFEKNRLSPTQWKLVDPFIPYFNYRLRFKSSQTNALLENFGFHWPEIDEKLLKRLFDFCIQCKYITLK